MKKLMLLALALGMGTLSYAQGEKIVSPLIKSAAEKQLTLQQAQLAYQKAARQYRRLTPPLVSSDYALKAERALRRKQIFLPAAWNNRLNRFLTNHITRLEAAQAQREEALVQYGKALVDAGELSALSGRGARRAVLFHHQPLLPNTKPFELYVRVLEQSASQEKLAKLPLKHRAMLLFLKRNLLARSEQLNQALRHSSRQWTLAMKYSLSVARHCTQMLYLMQQHPTVFQEDLFRLYRLAAVKPQTPFNNYIKASIRKLPFYRSYQAWLKAQQSRLRPASWEER